MTNSSQFFSTATKKTTNTLLKPQVLPFGKTVHSTSFIPTSPLPKKKSSKQWVDVHRNGNCGFEAIAVGIIDNSLRNPKGQRRLLTKLFAYEPKYLSIPKIFNTPIDYLHYIQKSPTLMSDFIGKLAYILRQLAVDEMCAKPVKYLGAFLTDRYDRDNQDKIPAKMRQSGTWINESAIAALANTLEVPICVKVVKEKKELPMALQYQPEEPIQAASQKKANQTSAEPIIVKLQVEQKHYLAQVHNAAPFSSLATTIPLAQTISKVKVDPDIETILEQIEAEKQIITKTFEEHLHRLLTMVCAGEVHKEELLAIYIQSASHEKSDYLRGQAKYLGFEHGSQAFFTDLMANHKFELPLALEENFDMQLITELVHALAQAMTIGQLNEDAVFAVLNKDMTSCRFG